VSPHAPDCCSKISTVTDVMTVRGPVPADELGVTLPHEHVFLDLTREYRGDGLLNDPDLAAGELQRYADAGGRTLVDVTTGGLNGDPAGLRAMSERTGLHIVRGAGFYRRAYFPPELDALSTDAVADLIVRDIEEGTDGVRAGIIGEIGCDRYLSAVEERSFRAAARAHRRTGLTITTHAARWPVGTAQLDLLVEEGVDPGRVVIGHCDMVPDHGYHLALAKRGAWVQFDTVQGVHEWDTRQRLGWLRSLADHGYLGQVLLSQDVCLRSDYAAMGGPGYAYVVTGVAGRLKEIGFDEGDVRRLLVDNPRRMLTGE
jgi:phosphotriesterase-related protein